MIATRRWLILLAALLLGGFAQPAHACSVPVFRYACERWLPDLYEVVLFHRGPLDGEPKALAQRLEKASLPNGGLSPLDVVTVDLAKELDGEMKAIWQAQKGAEPPWLVVRTPRHSHKPDQVWSARLTAASVDALLNSPVRQQIARAIRGGDCAIWVLLECGDTSQDDAAAELLRDQLRKMEKELKLPVLRADNPEDRIERGANTPELRVAFSMVRLARTNTAEALLVQMLLRCEEDLLKLDDKPMAFPVFGRGRALYTLVGKGINADTIEEACSFLIGPCGCEVKRLNPGSDLLITADWDASFRAVPGADKGLESPAGESSPVPVPEPIPMPALIEANASLSPASAASDGSSDAGLLNLFLVLAVGLAGTIAIALTMGKWRRI